jgi:hypothetical protein
MIFARAEYSEFTAKLAFMLKKPNPPGATGSVRRAAPFQLSARSWKGGCTSFMTLRLG